MDSWLNAGNYQVDSILFRVLAGSKSKLNLRAILVILPADLKPASSKFFQRILKTSVQDAGNYTGRSYVGTEPAGLLLPSRVMFDLAFAGHSLLARYE